MATYEADVTPQSGSVIDGDMRRIAKVTLLRYDTPDAKGVKAGQAFVRAWTQRGLIAAARDAADHLKRTDQAKRRDEIERRIERKQNARVDLVKRVSLAKKGRASCETR